MKSVHDLNGAIRAARKRMKRRIRDGAATTSQAFHEFVVTFSRCQTAIADRVHASSRGVKVVRWVTFNEAGDMPDAPGTSWHRQAVIDAIREGGLAFCGSAHQYADRPTVPVFSDGTVCSCTMRAWGQLMADAHGQLGEMDYCLWAWTQPSGVPEVYP